MLLRKAPASAPLRPLVRGYEERSASFADTCLTHPLPARPDLFIEIYLAERYRVSHNDGPAELSPELSLVGPHGHGRTRLMMTGEIRAFSIRFQPGALHRLARIDMATLANEGVPAGDVFGSLAGSLRDVVLAAPDFAARVAAAERWVASLAERARSPDRVDIAARILLRSGGLMRIDRLAAWTGLSHRQFGRRFSRQVGLNPKHYARTVRFNALLDARRRDAGASWTDLAHMAGYADQAHFVRECRDLTGAAPSVFFREWMQIGQS